MFVRHFSLLLFFVLIGGLARSEPGNPVDIQRCYHVFSGLTRGRVDVPFRDHNEHFLQNWIATAERFEQKLRTALDRESGSGYAILDTRALFPESLAIEILKNLPRESTVLTLDMQTGVEPRWSFTTDGQVETLPLSPTQTLFIEMTSTFGAHLLNHNLPHPERVKLIRAELRAIGREGIRSQLRRHTDGGYNTILVPLYGSGPDILNQWNKWISVRRGYTAVLSANDRGDRFDSILATEHRSPLSREERLLLVLNFASAGNRQ